MVRFNVSRSRVASGLIAFLLFLTLLPTRAAYGAPPDPFPDRRFGVVEAFWAPNHATEIGAGWERVLFWWNSLQPNSPNDWNSFYFPDEVLTQEIAQGREVVGLLMSAPSWANGSKDPRVPPKNLYLPYDDPNNYWGAFVKKIASRYRGRIDTWIIWNEPDIWEARDKSSTWLGSEADYYQLLKIAYQSAKSVNPSAKIVFAGLTYFWDKEYGREDYLKRVLDIAAKDSSARTNGFYFDIANVHLYNIPELMYTVPQHYKQIMAKHGLTKPIWLSEVNAPVQDNQSAPLSRSQVGITSTTSLNSQSPAFVGDRRPGTVDLEQQASFVIQASALSLAAGVDRVAFYKLRDDLNSSSIGETYGLMRGDGSARPSYLAFRAVTTYLSGARSAKWQRTGNLNSVVVKQNGKTTKVLWNSGSSMIEARIPASSSSGLLIDKHGFGFGITPIGGEYVILLPSAVAAVSGTQPHIGGDPFMLVEAAPTAVGPEISSNR